MWKDAETFLLKDRYLAPIVARGGHCNLKPRHKKYYFEDLVDAIVQQQLSMKAASSIFNRIKENIEYKKRLNGSIKKSYYIDKHKWRANSTKSTLITPEEIFSLKDEEFRECGLSKAKTLYIKDLAEKVLNGKINIAQMENFSDEVIINKLTSVKGIGEWTAHMFLMFSLGRPDIFPSGDLGLRNIFSKVIKKGLNRKQMDKFAQRWKPYRTIASWYIWKSLEE